MNKKGFSLIELLIVIVIIGIIVVIAVPNLLKSKQAAQETAAMAILRNAASAEVAYSARNNGDCGTVAQLQTQGYLDNRFSANPTGAIDGYTFNSSGGSGIFTITGTPVVAGSTRTMYITSDNVVRNAADNAPINTN